MTKSICKDDYLFIRNDKHYQGYAVLINCEGDMEFKVPETWTDEQVWTAMNIANAYYENGVKWGETKKELEIKKCLGIE
jgi:hypothetical protein